MHQNSGGTEREARLLACNGEQLLELLHDGLVIERQKVGLPLPGGQVLKRKHRTFI